MSRSQVIVDWHADAETFDQRLRNTKMRIKTETSTMIMNKKRFIISI